REGAATLAHRQALARREDLLRLLHHPLALGAVQRDGAALAAEREAGEGHVLRAAGPRRRRARIEGRCLWLRGLLRLVELGDLLARGAEGGEVGLRDAGRSEEHTSELQSLRQIVCRLLLEKHKRKILALTP